MSADPRTAIARLLDEQQPATLLLVGDGAIHEWQTWCLSHCDAEITTLPAAGAGERLDRLGRFECALVIGAVEVLGVQAGRELLGRLRNVHTDHLYVLARDDPRWPLTEWLALALQRADTFAIEGCSITLYAYDLATYNRVRSWNNSRYWANPQNWNRFRW